MQNNVFLRLAQERYTTKHYNGQQIPREEFDTLLEILRLTPTSVNAQALHYFTATSQEARERLLPAFPEFNRDRITGASDVVVFTVPKTLTEAHLRRVLDKEESDGRIPECRSEERSGSGAPLFCGPASGVRSRARGLGGSSGLHRHGVPPLRRSRHGHRLDGARRR